MKSEAEQPRAGDAVPRVPGPRDGWHAERRIIDIPLPSLGMISHVVARSAVGEKRGWTDSNRQEEFSCDLSRSKHGLTKRSEIVWQS
jgi:hypothetical protein